MPESPVEARDVLAAAAIMVGTLLGALPDEKREWLDDCVEKQGGMFTGAEKIQRASRLILREVDEPLSVVDDPTALNHSEAPGEHGKGQR